MVAPAVAGADVAPAAAGAEVAAAAAGAEVAPAAAGADVAAPDEPVLAGALPPPQAASSELKAAAEMPIAPIRTTNCRREICRSPSPASRVPRGDPRPRSSIRAVYLGRRAGPSPPLQHWPRWAARPDADETLPSPP